MVYTLRAGSASRWHEIMGQKLSRFSAGFGHRRPVERQAVQDFNRSLLLIVDPEALQASIAARLMELFACERILILQLDPERGMFKPTFSLGSDADELGKYASLRRHGRLAKWLLINETCLIVPRTPGVYEFLSDSEQELLTRLQIRICVPLISLNRLTGIIMLGSEKTGWDLTAHDLELLQLLAGQAGLAFENAYLYREQRERLRRIYRAERLAAAGQLAAGVAHEIRNPLTAIRSTIQYALQDYQQSNPKGVLLQELLAEVDRIDRTVNGLLSLTRLGEMASEPFDIRDVLEQSLLLVNAQAQRQGVEVTRPPAGHRFQIMGDIGQIKQVFLNLLLNALQAMTGGGRLETSLEEWSSEMSPVAGRWVQIRISDTGAGIPSENLDKVFDPFFTTKRDGTGLGLSVCHGIVHQHEGEIDLHSEIGKGTVVTLRFPLL
jgi:signal transduction histidine kinase